MSFFSCGIDEEVIPVVGIYRTHVLGVAGPFDLIISTHTGDNVLIEAPFDGENWMIVEADLDDKDERVIDIDIPKQTPENNMTIKGDGFYSDRTLELSYCIIQNGIKKDYTIAVSYTHLDVYKRQQ